MDEWIIKKERLGLRFGLKDNHSRTHSKQLSLLKSPKNFNFILRVEIALGTLGDHHHHLSLSLSLSL